MLALEGYVASVFAMAHETKNICSPPSEPGGFLVERGDACFDLYLAMRSGSLTGFVSPINYYSRLYAITSNMAR